MPRSLDHMSSQPPASPAALLRTAAYHNDLTAVEKLIDEGVDLNVWDKWGRTALSLAAGQGNFEVVELLLRRGAWVNPHEDYDTYQTPLYAAAESGHLDIVNLLISEGANPHLHVGVSQRTPAEYADANGHVNVANFLRKIMEANPPRSEGAERDR